MLKHVKVKKMLLILASNSMRLSDVFQIWMPRTSLVVGVL